MMPINTDCPIKKRTDGHVPDVVYELRRVGHCLYQVKNAINAVQFLAQTDRFVS